MIARAQRQRDRKVIGSNNYRKAAAKVAKRQRKVARMREIQTNTESLYYAENYGTIVIEDLKLVNLTKSAKGTEEKPGKNVKQKSGLNRAILDNGLGMIADQVKYKTEERGGMLLKEPSHYTSQECPNCHHIDPDNRPDQATFKCVKCGHQKNADINAAIVIKQRGIEQLEREKLKSTTKKQPVVKMKRLRRKPKIDNDTTVKPTVVLPVEDTRTISPADPGTDVREGIAHNRTKDTNPMREYK